MPTASRCRKAARRTQLWAIEWMDVKGKMPHSRVFFFVLILFGTKNSNFIMVKFCWFIDGAMGNRGSRGTQRPVKHVVRWFPEMGVPPIAGWFMMENTWKYHWNGWWLGVALFWKPSNCERKNDIDWYVLTSVEVRNLCGQGARAFSSTHFRIMFCGCENPVAADDAEMRNALCKSPDSDGFV